MIGEMLGCLVKDIMDRLPAVYKIPLGMPIETYPIKKVSKLKGRTKETDPGVMRISQKLTGRTKENNPSVKSMSEKLTGRTKENDISIARGAEKRTGRTKE
jgi:hypothetical protein